jgi:hypothetical protein
MISVRITGLTFLPALITSEKSIFTIIGYIMKKRQTAIGIDTTGAPSIFIDKESNLAAACGAIFPSAIPAAIQRITQTVRYFSKKESPFGCLVIHASDVI